MQYTISNKQLKVTIRGMGAEIVSVIAGGKERVWQNPTGEWAGHGPVLFPVCGHCGVQVDGVSYPLPAHGFSKKTEYSLLEKGDDFVTLFISSNEETKKVYPYNFTFYVTYRLCENTVTVEFKMSNPDEKPLYFACGGHESFAIDSDVDGYQIEFEKEEKFLHWRNGEGGYLTGETQDLGSGKIFALPADFFVGGTTLVLKDTASKRIRFMQRDGKPLADITFEGFANLLLWRADRGRFICIEPWTNLPDVAGEPEVEFAQKFGVLKVDGNSEKTLVRTITYL